VVLLFHSHDVGCSASRHATCCSGTRECIEQFILHAESAFISVDEAWIKSSNSDDSGTTATLGMIQGQKLTIAHVGDTRALIIKKDGTCARPRYFDLACSNMWSTAGVAICDA
jgi:serine/threonine protein phosphatase PrpC